MKRLLAIMLATAALAASTSMTVFADGGGIPSTREASQTAEGLSFETDNGVDINGGLLTPGVEYRFKILYTGNNANGRSTMDFTDEHLTGNKFIVENKAGRGTIENFRVGKSDGKYYLMVKPKAGWPTKQTDVEYKIKLVNTKNGQAVDETNVEFLTGYRTIADDDLLSASVDEAIYVPNETPVVKKSQFEQINSYTNGKAASFTNGDWTVNVRVGGLDDRNLISNANGIAEIETKFENNNFKFVTFPAGPKFDYTAKINVDVAAESETFGDNFHLYRYLNGTLTPMDSTYDRDTHTVSFSTKDLGRFVLTDSELKDTTIVESSSSSSTDTSDTSSGSGSSGNNGGTNNNPNTGAGAGLGIAVAVAGAALVAGTLTVKKK